MNRYKSDLYRYGGNKKLMPKWQKYFRKYQDSKTILKYLYLYLFSIYRKGSFVEISSSLDIKEGAYFGHPYLITINNGTKIGKNCNIHKGVTIGQENRGIRKGCPTIGDCVWIGINATIVGNIKIGNNVLIAPNSYVNCDVPNNSIVFGNPCIIKPSKDATKDYIINKI